MKPHCFTLDSWVALWFCHHIYMLEAAKTERNARNTGKKSISAKLFVSLPAAPRPLLLAYLSYPVCDIAANNKWVPGIRGKTDESVWVIPIGVRPQLFLVLFSLAQVRRKLTFGFDTLLHR